ncbi:MAG: hypothetical protein ACR2JE_15975 [Acidobacteriaceae bacterium]
MAMTPGCPDLQPRSDTSATTLAASQTFRSMSANEVDLLTVLPPRDIECLRIAVHSAVLEFALFIGSVYAGVP